MQYLHVQCIVYALGGETVVGGGGKIPHPLLPGKYPAWVDLNCLFTLHNIIPSPNWSQGVSVEAVDPVFQAKMLDMLKQTGRPEMVVGWYHSHPGFGCWLSGVDINTQQSFEALSARAVAVVVDPIQSVKGQLLYVCTCTYMYRNVTLSLHQGFIIIHMYIVLDHIDYSVHVRVICTWWFMCMVVGVALKASPPPMRTYMYIQ